MCYILELCSLCVTYFKDMYKTYIHNYCNYVPVLRNYKLDKIKLKGGEGRWGANVLL